MLTEASPGWWVYGLISFSPHIFQIFYHKHALTLLNNKSMHIIKEELEWNPYSPIFPCPQSYCNRSQGSEWETGLP